MNTVKRFILILIIISTSLIPTVGAKERSTGKNSNKRPHSLDLSSQRLKDPLPADPVRYVDREIASEEAPRWRLTEPREMQLWKVDVKTKKGGTTSERYPFAPE